MQTWQKRLVQFRKERGLNQVELARIAGLTQGKISQLESGSRHSFSFDTLLKVLKALKKDLPDIFCDKQ